MFAGDSDFDGERVFLAVVMVVDFAAGALVLHHPVLVVQDWWFPVSFRHIGDVDG